MVLQKMKRNTEDYLGTTVNEARSYCSHILMMHKDKQLKRAGEIMGLKVSRIINEPTALFSLWFR